MAHDAQGDADNFFRAIVFLDRVAEDIVVDHAGDQDARIFRPFLQFFVAVAGAVSGNWDDFKAWGNNTPTERQMLVNAGFLNGSKNYQVIVANMTAATNVVSGDLQSLPTTGTILAAERANLDTRVNAVRAAIADAFTA